MNPRKAMRSPEEIVAALEETPRDELLQIIHSMWALEPLFSAKEIAARSGIPVRDVRRAINAGEIGGGFFCRGANSKKVPASAANAWRQRFFVKVEGNGGSRK